MKKITLFKKFLIFSILILFGSNYSGNAQTMMPLPTHGSNYTGYVRGYWFIAPTSFTITGLKIPSEAGAGLQNIQVMKISGLIAAWPALGTNFTNLFYVNNAPNNVVQPTSIQINAGDTIGILGQAGTVTSYSSATSPISSTINGLPLELNRFIYQGSIDASAAPEYSTELSGQIGRVEMYYSVAPCSGQPSTGTLIDTIATCSGSAFTISPVGASIGSGLSYQWQSRNPIVTGTWTNITGATSFSYSSPGVSSSTQFRYIMVCSTSNLSDTSSVVTVALATPFPSGTYTINPAIPSSGTNFQSIGDAVSAISCGIAGPVVFNMAAGNTFNEQVTLPSSIGTSATNTVTFNGNGDTVNFTGTATLPWTIGLDGADYITFNNLVIKGNGTNAYVVHLWNDADYNTFTNCTIMAPENGSSTTQIPFSISGSATSMASGASGSYNIVDSCTIISGYYNVYLYGNSGTPSVGNQITNSTLKDFYTYGSYNFYQSGLLVKNNIVERPSRTTLSSFYGIYLSTGCVNSTIEQNRIRNQFGGNPTYSGTSYNIYASSTSATVGNENKIINNIIGNVNGNSSVYGIYMPSAIHTQVYFNTLSIDNTSATTGTVYGIYSTGTSGGIDVRNNNIVITQGGSGTKYCLYYSSSAAGKTSNNNNLYIGSTTGTNYIGYLSSAQSTLANWQAAAGAGFDLQSVSIDPVFVSPAIGNFTPTNAAVNDLGTPISGITTDFLGTPRSTTTPDIGAYEFSVAPCTGTVTAGTASVPSPTVCGGTNILLNAAGATAPAGGLVGNWQSRPTAGGPWTDITGATMPSYNLGLGVNVATDFRYWMTCSNNGNSDTSNIVSVTILPPNQCYCTPGGSGTSYYITNFNTTGAAQNVNVSNTSFATGGYKDNTTTDTVTQVQSSSVNVSFTGAPSNTYGFAVWVDWNQNGTFEASEKMFNTSSYSASATGTFTVPVTALAGTTRMRIGSNYLNSAGPDPCENSAYTYFEDFTFQVVALLNCSGTVSAGTVTGPAGVCATNSFTLSTAGVTIPSSGLAGNWQSAPSATGPWTDIVGETSTSLTVATGITTATSYRYWIACSYTSNSDTSNVVTLTMNPANQCYCIPPPPSISGLYWINDVSTTGGSLNINNANTGADPNGYGDYTNLIVEVAPADSFNFEVKAQSGASPGISIWIDWDQSGTFDANEEVYSSNAGSSSTLNVYTDVIQVPSTALSGTTRMRIRNYTNRTPCGQLSYGEAEDYTVNVASSTPPPTPIVIGVGSGTGSSSYYPNYYLYDYSYTQTVYSAAELVAGGATSTGMITKVYYKPKAGVSTVKWRDWVIYMGNTTQNGFANTGDVIPVGNLTQVFSDTIINNTIANDWIEIVLSTPFLWDGSSNLVVAVDENTPSYGNSPNWAGYTATPISGTLNRGVHFYQDGTNILPSAPSASSSAVSNSIAQIQFEWTAAPPCSGTPTAGAITGPLAALCPGSSFSLNLSGSTIAAGINYQWQSKAASASTWSNITGATSTSYNEASGVLVATDYRAIVTCATSAQSDTSNVVSVTVAPLFAGGTYTINPAIPASGTNFQSMGDAVSAISCGIGGPIIFNMAAGNTFNEQVTLPSIYGTSATNTITFNGNGDTVNFTGTATLPWTIGLNGADYISFNNLVVTGNGNNAYVVHLWNDADHNTFTNCTILAPENGTATTQIPFSISGSATSMATGASGSYNTLDSCTIVNGYYNVYLYGNSVTPSVGNQVLNSTLKDFYMYGSNNYYQSGLLVKNNIVERPTRTTITTFYGIYLSTGCVNSTIEQNRIRNQFGSNPSYSGTSYNIYASSTAATVGNENKIINNVIGNVNGNSSVYGIYMPSAIHTQVYFNTISIDNTNATTGTVYGIYSTGTTGGIDIRNNNVVVTQGGSGTKYCLYYSAATGKVSNHNNLYMGSTTGSNYIGYLSSAQSTLANWQAAAGAGFDLQSVSIDPVFVSPATGDFTPTNAAVNDLGTPIAGITTDFLGATRSTTTPDIGAYEFTVSGCTGTVTAGTASVPSPTVCGGTNILLTATGATAPAGGLTGNWQSRPTAGGPWTNITGATMPSYNLGLGVNVATDFRYWMTCSNNGSSDTSNVVSVSLLPGIQCYCTPTYTNTSDYLSAFSTTGGTQNISYTGTSSSGSYQNLTSQVVGQFQGQIINLSTTYVGGSNTVMIWVDYNGDGMFDDITERVYNYYSSAATNTGSFTVPTSVAAGQYRMRVRSGYGNLTTMDACNNQSYGSALDFTLNVTALIGCSGTVSAGTVSGPAGVCAINSFTLTTIGATSPASGLAGNWQSAPSVTGPWTNISGATTTSLTVGSGITTATSYRYWIACSFSSSTDTSNVVTVTMNPANQCYCTPVYTTGCAVGDDISNVTLNGVTTNINNSTGCSPNAYGDYTNLPPADLNPGGTFSLKVSTSYSYPEDEYATAWIDYNQNGAFEANEVIFNTPNGLQTGGTTQTFVVPSTQAAGLYRMRVRSVYYPSITPVNPCTSESYGETEDYMVQVTAPCPIVPINLGADTTICGNTPLTLNAGSQPTGATYTWSTGASTQTISVNTTGTYSVVVSDGTCSKSDTINVTYGTIPTVNLGADTTICDNASLTLSAGSQPTGSTYTWSTGASTQTISVNTTGTYSVLVSNGTCSKSDTINVTVAPSPVVNLGNDTAICAGDSLTLDAGSGTSTYLWNTGATTQTINVTTSGTYSITVTNASGCSTSDSIDVTVNPYPVVDLGADTVICDGGPFVLDAGGNVGDTYLWAPIADTTSSITITTSGTYSVTVTNSSGCSTSDTIEVTISDLPTVNGITSSGTSPTFNFSPNTPVNVTDYLWDFGDGDTSTLENPSHTYDVLSQTKVYTVTLTVSNDCGDQTVITTVTVLGDRIKDLSLNANDLRLYPNPTQQTVTIDNHSGFKMKNIIITNVLGQQVMKIAVKDNKQIIDVSHLVSGLYQVTIEFDEGIINRKLEVIK